MRRGGVRRVVLGSLTFVLALAAVAGADAQGSGPTATVEVRVWQDVGDELDIYISARPATGLWQTLGTIPLPLDDGVSSTGRYRYGDIALGVPLANRATPATVEVRVWQDVGDSARIYVSARPAGGDWRVLGTIRLLLDDGLSSDGRYRFGDISLEVPLPQEQVRVLAGRPGDWGYQDGRGTAVRFGRTLERSIGDLDLDVAPDGSVIVADRANDAVRRVAPDGTVSTLAGGQRGYLPSPVAVAVDAEGSIYVAGAWNGLIYRLSSDGRASRVVAGGGSEDYPFQVPPDAPAGEARFSAIKGLAAGPEGDLYIIEQDRIRRLTPAGWVTSVAGGSGLGHVDGPGEQAQFNWLEDIVVDGAGSVYVVDRSYVSGEGSAFTTIRKVDTDGVVTTLFQDTPPGHGGVLAAPTGLALTDDGEILISNAGRHQILRLTAEGTLEAIAGSGDDGYLDGSREAAALSFPGSLAVLPGGGLVVEDQAGSVLRAIAPDPSGSFASEIALAGGEPVPRVQGVRVEYYARHLAFLPAFLELDTSGDVVVSAGAIRSVSPDGTVTTLAGANGVGYRDGPREEAQFRGVRGIALASDGSIYVADYGNDRIRTISPDGDVTTLALPGPFEIVRPEALAFDGDGNLLIAQSFPGRLFRLSASGEVSTLIGDEEALQFIHGIAVSDEGDAYVTARRNELATIVRVTPGGDVSTVFQGAQAIHGGIFTRGIRGMAVAGDGTLYVVDSNQDRVVRVSPDGTVAIVVEPDAVSPHRFASPYDIAIAPDGSLLLSSLGAIWRISFEEDGE